MVIITPIKLNYKITHAYCNCNCNEKYIKYLSSTGGHIKCYLLSLLKQCYQCTSTHRFVLLWWVNLYLSSNQCTLDKVDIFFNIFIMLNNNAQLTLTKRVYLLVIKIGWNNSKYVLYSMTCFTRHKSRTLWT